MKRLKWYKTVMNKVCLDERLSPNRRMMAGLIGMYMDADEGEEQKLMKAILLGEFVTGKGIKYFDKEDDNIAYQRELTKKLEKDADESIKSVFDAVLGTEIAEIKEEAKS